MTEELRRRNRRTGFPYNCATCGKPNLSPTGTRGKFCNKVCFGLSIRKNRTVKEKKEIKRLYDIEYRAKNRERLIREKREYYQANHARFLAMGTAKRRTREYKAKMREYLATYWTPELKALKKDYDRKWRARKTFGPLWEIHYLTVLLNQEVKGRMSNYEIRLQNKTLNKALMRSRNGEIKRSYT